MVFAILDLRVAIEKARTACVSILRRHFFLAGCQLTKSALCRNAASCAEFTWLNTDLCITFWRIPVHSGKEQQLKRSFFIGSLFVTGSLLIGAQRVCALTVMYFTSTPGSWDRPGPDTHIPHGLRQADVRSGAVHEHGHAQRRRL